MDALNLFQLLNGKIFRIPDYQRGFAWGEKQLSELWDDIEEIQLIDNEYSKHYTGTIFLEQITAPQDENWFSGVTFNYVVDGQQRLTTLSILLFELLKLAENGHSGESKDDLFKTYIKKTNATGNSTIYKFCYAETDKNCKFLKKNIFEDDSVILDNNVRNLYTKNLEVAKEFFKKKLANLTYEQREILFKKLTTSLLFDLRPIEMDLDIQVVFETMNNRGKPLSTLEKLKNRLIYLSNKLPNISKEDKSQQRKSINDAWGKIYNCLAQNPDINLDEDVFLSAHLTLYRKPKDAVFSEHNAEEKVFQMFCNRSEKYEKDESGEKEEPVSFEKIKDYIIKLSEAGPIWYKIHDSNDKLLKKILLLDGSKEVKVFLLSIFLNIAEADSIKIILRKLEQVLFRNRIPGIGVIDERTFASWGRDLYFGDESIDGINVKLDKLLQQPLSNDNLIQSMNSLYTYERGPKGFHKWSGLKYFLFEYEDYLKAFAKETDDKINLSDFDLTTIEHVIPQMYRENWPEVMNNFIIGLEEDQAKIAAKVLINSLGNLTILKNGKNSSLGNRSWLDKKERFRTGSYNEIAISIQPEWTRKEIFERGLDMLNFLQKKVNGLNFNENELAKILFYQDFIIKRIKD